MTYCVDYADQPHGVVYVSYVWDEDAMYLAGGSKMELLEACKR
jgi:hypothetical protein